MTSRAVEMAWHNFRRAMLEDSELDGEEVNCIVREMDSFLSSVYVRRKS